MRSRLLNGMGGGTLIGLLHAHQKHTYRYSEQPILDLRRAQE